MGLPDPNAFSRGRESRLAANRQNHRNPAVLKFFGEKF
jgi:hypothetical protein